MTVVVTVTVTVMVVMIVMRMVYIQEVAEAWAGKGEDFLKQEMLAR